MSTIIIQFGSSTINIDETVLTLEVGTYMPSGGGGGDLLAANNLSDVANASTSRTNLGLQIGLDVQAYNPDIVIDASYVHTDNNFTNTLKTNYNTAYTHSQATHAPTNADNTANNETPHTNVAVTNAVQIFTASQRGLVTTDNDLSLSLLTTNNFKCTPTATGQLTFTDLADGQGGRILFDNSGGHVITKNALVLAGSTFLDVISTAGKYMIGYECDGVNVWINSTQALT